MISQHHVVGLQTGCMMVLLAPVVEAAKFPRVCPMPLGYGLPPCNDNDAGKSCKAKACFCSTSGHPKESSDMRHEIATIVRVVPEVAVTTLRDIPLLHVLLS